MVGVREDSFRDDMFDVSLEQQFHHSISPLSCEMEHVMVGLIPDCPFRCLLDSSCWQTVTYQGWLSTLVDTGLPFVSEQRGTAALQRHLLLTTEKRAAIMKQRLKLAKILWDSATIGTQRTGDGVPRKKICIRMISKEPATFSGGGVGRDTRGSHGGLDAVHRH